MIGRFRVLAVTMAIVGLALGGCADQTSSSSETQNANAMPEATRSGTPSAAEITAERTVGGGDRGWMPGSITGLVTKVSRQPNDSHWIAVEKDPGADCGTRAKQRGDSCARWGLQILDGTEVLRGEGTTRGRRPPQTSRRTRRSTRSPATP